MPRAVSGTVSKHKVRTVLKYTKGFRGARSKLFRPAKNAMIKALSNAYVGRKHKKRIFRQLWIARINAACRNEGITYSVFMNGLKKANININRKNLSNLAIENIDAFKQLIVSAKAALK